MKKRLGMAHFCKKIYSFFVKMFFNSVFWNSGQTGRQADNDEKVSGSPLAQFTSNSSKKKFFIFWPKSCFCEKRFSLKFFFSFSDLDKHKKVFFLKETKSLQVKINRIWSVNSNISTNNEHSFKHLKKQGSWWWWYWWWHQN